MKLSEMIIDGGYVDMNGIVRNKEMLPYDLSAIELDLSTHSLIGSDRRSQLIIALRQRVADLEKEVERVKRWKLKDGSDMHFDKS